MNYIDNDFYFSNDGDFVLSNERDFQDTKESPYRSLFQEIRARLNFNRGEWANDIGANLQEFVGLKNDDKLAEKIKLRVKTELTRSSLISSSDLSVDVFPLNEYQVMISLRIKTPNNKVISFYEKFSLKEKKQSFRDK